MKDALLVVDVVSRFDHEDGDRLLESFRERLPEMCEALEAARGGGVPVVYVNDACGRWDGDAPGLVRTALDGPGADVVSALAPRAGEAFLFKPRYSAFDHTAVELHLRELEAERLLLMGGATEACIVQTGIDARELGFKVTILAGACATLDRELERLSLRYAEDVGGMHVVPDAAAVGL